MATAQQIIDLARVPLNDADKDRYTDVALLRFLNAFLRHLKTKRPDFFLGSLGTDFVDLAIGDAVPTPQSVDQALADYLTARAGTTDDEASGRIDMFLTFAGAQL